MPIGKKELLLMNECLSVKRHVNNPYSRALHQLFRILQSLINEYTI